KCGCAVYSDMKQFYSFFCQKRNKSTGMTGNICHFGSYGFSAAKRVKRIYYRQTVAQCFFVKQFSMSRKRHCMGHNVTEPDSVFKIFTPRFVIILKSFLEYPGTRGPDELFFI